MTDFDNKDVHTVFWRDDLEESTGNYFALILMLGDTEEEVRERTKRVPVPKVTAEENDGEEPSVKKSKQLPNPLGWWWEHLCYSGDGDRPPLCDRGALLRARESRRPAEAGGVVTATVSPRTSLAYRLTPLEHLAMGKRHPRLLYTLSQQRPLSVSTTNRAALRLLVCPGKAAGAPGAMQWPGTPSIF
ncbi:hypothetical protein HPB50_016379 [Hyalomma asiaticum]|uniref:Uncharacterized protein n=1 Tax=Hyalomma asiaticum TaxID=266040 RepID=A0ACB7RJG9_HYAAI|nr:hypothetical protein HPB50_016379 [Hyalomma asiaticum]